MIRRMNTIQRRNIIHIQARSQSGRTCLGLLIALQICFALGAARADEPGTRRALDVLDDAAAWHRLSLERVTEARLPIWARALATPLPRTTVAMLELDYLHRVASPLEARLRARIRWTAAHANRCPYGAETALADLRRFGVAEAELSQFVEAQSARGPSDPNDPGDLEQATLDFARRLTLDASTVTDEQVSYLMESHGDKQVVAIVLLVAYANFLDRMLHSFGLAGVDDSPYLPVVVQRSSPSEKNDVSPPPRTPPAEPPPADDAAARELAEWSRVSFAQLQGKLDSQRARKSRIRVPEPPAATDPQRNPLRVRWSLVCLGYQPKLAGAWFQAMGTFARESRQDRVFEESLFWVITRSIDCFY